MSTWNYWANGACLRLMTVVLMTVVVLLLLPQNVAAAQSTAPGISISSILGTFLRNTTDSGTFSASPSTPVAFTQEFTVLNFNPPTGTVACSNRTGVDSRTRPFTNVVPQPDGSCRTLVAQGNGQQGGVGDLANFHAVFTGSFSVAAPGQVTFNFFSDDGWIFSIGPNSAGAQPSYVSGPMLNFPKAGPFTGYGIVGAFNVVSAPTQTNLVVNFPSAGSFPFELDYSECCDGDLAFTVTANGAPIPATTQLAFDVRGLVNTAQVQGRLRIEVAIASGQAQHVELLVDDRSQGVGRTPPFTFDWDAGRETPGTHRVVVRAVDARGVATDKTFVVDVIAVVDPPTQVPAVVVRAAEPASDGNAPLLATSAVLFLVLAGVAVYFFARGSGARPEPSPAPTPAAAPPVEDNTEFIGRESLSDLTAISSRRPQVLPKAKLLLKPDRELLLSRSSDTVLGRDTANGVVVEDRHVSRHHARITCDDGDFWIEDLNSTNGTRVNGVPVQKQKLANNDQIGLGEAIVTFTVESV